MARTIKTVVKDINKSLLRQELVASTTPAREKLMAGFHRRGQERYTPFTARAERARRTGAGGNDVITFADPGELHFESPNPLTSAEETVLDDVLAAHDSTQESVGQTNKRLDTEAGETFKDNFKNWGAMNPQAKDAHHELMAHAMARLLGADPDS